MLSESRDYLRKLGDVILLQPFQRHVYSGELPLPIFRRLHLVHRLELIHLRDEDVHGPLPAPILAFGSTRCVQLGVTLYDNVARPLRCCHFSQHLCAVSWSLAFRVTVLMYATL
jgi:hypothetical protein